MVVLQVMGVCEGPCCCPHSSAHATAASAELSRSRAGSPSLETRTGLGRAVRSGVLTLEAGDSPWRHLHWMTWYSRPGTMVRMPEGFWVPMCLPSVGHKAWVGILQLLPLTKKHIIFAFKCCGCQILKYT